MWGSGIIIRNRIKLDEIVEYCIREGESFVVKN